MTDFIDEVQQSCLQGTDIRGNPDRYPIFNYNVVIEGVVVGIHYPGDPQNRSGKEIEYDVDPTSCLMRRLSNVIRADGGSGVDEADDTVLRAAKNSVQQGQAVNMDGSAGPPVGYTPRLSMDGDKVLVTFVNANVQRPVIIGVLKHPLNKVGFTDVRGEKLLTGADLVRRVRHRGTEFVVDADGNMSVDFGPHPDPQSQVGEKKKLTIHLGSMDLVFDNTGTSTLLTVDGGGSSDFAALASLVLSALQDFSAKFNSHTHLDPVSGSSPVPVPQISPPTTVASEVLEVKG